MNECCKGCYRWKKFKKKCYYYWEGKRECFSKVKNEEEMIRMDNLRKDALVYILR